MNSGMDMATATNIAFGEFVATDSGLKAAIAATKKKAAAAGSAGFGLTPIEVTVDGVTQIKKIPVSVASELYAKHTKLRPDGSQYLDQAGFNRDAQNLSFTSTLDMSEQEKRNKGPLYVKGFSGGRSVQRVWNDAANAYTDPQGNIDSDFRTMENDVSTTEEADALLKKRAAGATPAPAEADPNG